jgi:hypothetical protein
MSTKYQERVNVNNISQIHTVSNNANTLLKFLHVYKNRKRKTILGSVPMMFNIPDTRYQNIIDDDQYHLR